MNKIASVKTVQKIFKLIISFCIIAAFLILGKFIHTFLSIPMPSSVIGLILLFCSLSFRLIRLEWVLPSGNILLKYMTLFFVPAGVGLINYLELLNQYWLTILISSFASTIIVLVCVGLGYERLSK